ncbi:MAG TPA: hypothetical protein VFO10_17265 [Oligoflexus sp.]|uniref:hypothetical protein n=1 Tax=Oligoflexus sp. TaxID=1971216 RepID=UPI002D7ED032|nr:hypothetical protein [Oligoflexus sp.]HET9239011.1 hypothetical protein [Oligoflexus sp.]
MIEWNEGFLEAELIRMMREQPKPLNLEEIFSLLYSRRERLPELMAMTRERTLELRRLKRNLDQSVYRGWMEAIWQNGEVYYKSRDQDRISLAARPYQFQIASNRNDRLLNIFCVIALLVLALLALFLMHG